MPGFPRRRGRDHLPEEGHVAIVGRSRRAIAGGVGAVMIDDALMLTLRAAPLVQFNHAIGLGRDGPARAAWCRRATAG